MDESAESREITLADLGDPDVLLHLGALCAQMLLAYRTATVMVDEEDFVRAVSPDTVYLGPQPSDVMPGKKLVATRPLLVRNNPRYVVVRDDGSLWEAEVVDDQPTDTSKK